ncbi:hypothetical protein [Victivallis vadensis]|uniref:hypothetical protein n=1 Tax=Victivallis vadensis TaxID=172901 RepID=UPI00307D47B9
MKRFLFLLSLIAGVHLAAAPVDRYGQAAELDWPEKVSDDSELRNDLERETKELAGVKRESGRFDRYGGVRSGRTLRATGFFRVEKVEGRWWLVTPEGNLFYLQGVDGVPYNEHGYFTQVNRPDGSRRDLFTEGVPDPGQFPAAWSKDKKCVSFLTANIRRKYGPDYHKRWMDLTTGRLLAWGFNSIGKWNNPFVVKEMPFLWDQGLLIRDPYDPDFERSAEKQIKAMCAGLKNNPFLIGYQLANESGWNRHSVDARLKDVSGKSHAKRALLEQLAAATGGKPGKFFGLPEESIDRLMLKKLDFRKVPSRELDAFILKSSQRYHSTLRRLIRLYDPNHLFLGASHCSKQDIRWIEGAAEFVDIVPLHLYDMNNAWILNFVLPVLKRLDKPYAQLEFSFTTTLRGFRPFGDRKSIVASHRDRGRAFQYSTERMAAEPLCVGTAYFLMYDQPLTSRGHDNEAFNFGLIDVTDRPYREMIASVKEANARLFGIHAGKLAPVRPEPLLLVEKNYREIMPFSQHGFHGYDMTNPQLHFNQSDRLHLYFPGGYRHDLSGKFLPLATVDANRPNGFRKLEFQVFLWKQANPGRPEKWFQLEESPDNTVFTPVKAKFKLLADGPFRKYAFSPVSLAADTRYVRISFAQHNPEQPWISSLSGVSVERR